ncbi:MAG: ABC transporter permease, partial [Dehalococcoidia bacterium]|nr:ABC transporter permease [Dehalococcoidia bacterium]
MRQFRYIWFLALKDLKLFATDRMAVSFFILFPFFFVVLFGVLLGGDGAEDSRLELHLVTQEAEGGLSHEIIGAVETRDESVLQPGEPKIVWHRDYDEARRAVEDKEIAGFLAFPADFTEGVLMGYGAQLEVVADAEAVNTRAALNGLARAIASRVGSEQVATSAIIGLLVGEGLASSADMAGIGQAIQQLFSDWGAGTAEES